jgi:hypothetical protein
MGYVRDYKLGTIIGGTTAGANGGVAAFSVPGVSRSRPPACGSRDMMHARRTTRQECRRTFHSSRPGGHPRWARRTAGACAGGISNAAVSSRDWLPETGDETGSACAVLLTGQRAGETPAPGGLVAHRKRVPTPGPPASLGHRRLVHRRTCPSRLPMNDVRCCRTRWDLLRRTQDTACNARVHRAPSAAARREALHKPAVARPTIGCDARAGGASARRSRWIDDVRLFALE